MSSYIPPHLRARATAGSTPAPTAPLAVSVPTNPRYSDRGGSRGGQRGDIHGSARGNTRGGHDQRGRNRRQAIDDQDVVGEDDITRHYWPQDDDNVALRIRSRTFHDSAACQDKLSYMLLFAHANPRWNSEGFVFAKSNLSLLPGYVDQKSKGGPLIIPVTTAKTQLKQELSREPHTTEQYEGLSVEQSSQDVPGGLSISTGRANLLSSSNTNPHAIPPSPSHVKIVPASEFYVDNHTTQYPSIPAIDYTPEAHEPIAVFQQVKGVSNDGFVFTGWYQVAQVNIIAPCSAELVRMQQQKWEKRDKWGNTITTQSRDGSAWRSSMDHEWAVVKFEKMSDDVAPPKPSIGKLKPKSRTNSVHSDKGVSEMLQEMKLKDGTVDIGV